MNPQSHNLCPLCQKVCKRGLVLHVVKHHSFNHNTAPSKPVWKYCNRPFYCLGRHAWTCWCSLRFYPSSEGYMIEKHWEMEGGVLAHIAKCAFPKRGDTLARHMEWDSHSLMSGFMNMRDKLRESKFAIKRELCHKRREARAAGVMP